MNHRKIHVWLEIKYSWKMMSLELIPLKERKEKDEAEVGAGGDLRLYEARGAGVCHVITLGDEGR